MKKILLQFLIFSFTLWFGIIAITLSGEEFEDAVDILVNALSQLRKKNDGPYLTLRGVRSAAKIIPHVIFTFDAQLLGPDHQVDFCIVEISIALITNPSTLVVITCSGVEKHRQLLNVPLSIDA
ncbi:uncharacterized protein ACRADG_001110 [Cochliomyia hominivorax]